MSLEISEAEWQEAKRRTNRWVESLPPHEWIELPMPPKYPELEGQRAFSHRDGRRVIVSVGSHNGEWWLHVSVSRAKYIPSYEDLSDVKRTFVTNAVQAVQIFPRHERHVNIHPYCLHLWACLDSHGDGLPDFGSEGTI
jgi:hypothetical protein